MPQLALLALLIGASAQADDTPLSKTIDKILDGPHYPGARWGVLFVDTESGETVYARKPDDFCTPASTTKLFSGAAALATFGAKSVTKTPVYRRGDMDGTRLNGDLILVAKGDLTLGGRRTADGKTAFQNDDHIYAEGGPGSKLTETDALLGLKSLAKQVRDSGITHVTGKVIIDARLFKREFSTGSGPRTISPIMVNDNAIDIIVTPAKQAGKPATVTTRPATKYFRLDAKIETASATSGYHLRGPTGDDPGPFVVRGSVPAGGEPALAVIGIVHPANFARTLFIECLTEAGVTVDEPLIGENMGQGLPDSKTGYKNLPIVAEWKSEPFADVLKVTMKVSHNLYASSFPLLMAAAAGKRTEAEGMREEARALKAIGLDPERVSFGGGAGGSAADHVTPRATVDLLRALQKRDDWPAFQDALPVMGVDGTLASVGTKGHAAKGKVFAKSGSLPYTDQLNGRRYLVSKALAGVMTTKSGRKLTFAIFENDVILPKGVPTSRESKALGAICEAVYDGL